MPSDHQLLVFWIQLLVLLFAARGLGAVLARFGQPRVVGEIAAGLLLGPSVLGQLAPAAGHWLFPDEAVQKAMLAAVAWVGAFLLLVVTGIETDVALVRRLGAATMRVALGSLILPVAVGVALGLAMPALFIGQGIEREIFALFFGVAFAISALPVIAKILSELSLMRRNIAQMILAAAMLDDVAGWILLGVVAGLAKSGSIDLGRLGLTLAGLAVFLLLAFTLGQRGLDALLRRSRLRRAGVESLVSIALGAALFAGSLTHAIGLEAVFGAFIAGIVFGRSRFQGSEVFGNLQTVAFSFLAPIFFASAGLRVDLSLLAESEVVRWGLLVLAAASASKFLGALLGSRLARLPLREGLALGAGLNARGAVGIVIATVGLSLGVLNERSYTLVVLMAMVTSMMAPPMLRAILHGWHGSDEERERLERESVLGGNVLVRPTRVLLPTHGGPNSVLAARILDLAWPEGVEFTLLTAGDDVPKRDVDRLRAVFTDRRVVLEHVAGKDTLDVILEHAVLGYGAVAVGATDVREAQRLVSPVVDALLAASPIPVVMVRRGPRDDPEEPPRYRRILVPAIGTAPGRAALEIACSIARRLQAEVLAVHVITTPSLGQRFGLRRLVRAPDDAAGGSERAEVAERVVAEACILAERMGVRAEGVIRMGTSAATELLALQRESGADLLVLAANLRQLSERPFLGHGVEFLLEKAETTVIVVTAPPGFST